MSMSQSTPAPMQHIIAGSSKKNEDASMSAILLAPLTDIQSLAHTLFQSLSPPQTKPPPPPPLSAFLECDQKLAAAVNLAHSHQVKQRKIESLEQELLELERSWRDICTELAKGKRELEQIIEDGNERIKAIDTAKKAAIPYPALLAYAERLAVFTSAPPNMPDTMVPGQPLPAFLLPPFPTEETMRRGKLNAEAPLGTLGETHTIVKAPTPSPVAETNQHAQGVNPYRHEFREPQPQFFDFDLDLNPDLDEL
ncbi:hypothetical protein FA15DRAFT_307245 [Coprinopsis marcescibilis]|uniref:Mediator of RNA polymerase II transcription subunit 4 n=1 Tax=Coprinopsis marcescibilis TaxID=230819 RepID=A0A5C3L0L0_COPMA|nr:hypothetical protein FA15DRAFT_307245 [Coprinopsis marcescibilis]